MTVVSDTSPINYLLLLASIELLPQLYGRVTIPAHVREELLDPAGPALVREWAAAPPDWLEVRRVTTLLSGPAMAALDRGEQEAISLAVELRVPVLIADRRGRKVAQAQGLRIVGTLGILGTAAERGLVDLRAEVESLTQHTNFRVGAELLRSFLGHASAGTPAQERESEVVAPSEEDGTPDLGQSGNRDPDPTAGD